MSTEPTCNLHDFPPTSPPYRQFTDDAWPEPSHDEHTPAEQNPSTPKKQASKKRQHPDDGSPCGRKRTIPFITLDCDDDTIPDSPQLAHWRTDNPYAPPRFLSSVFESIRDKHTDFSTELKPARGANGANGAFRIPDASVLTSSHTPRIHLCDAEINRFTKKISAELSQMTHEYVLLQLYWSRRMFHILDTLKEE